MTYKIECLKGIKSNWYHKWCDLVDSKLNEFVKGPLNSPMVAIPIPYTLREKDDENQCDCAKHIRVCYSRPGIPDPWEEYLIMRRETRNRKNVINEFPKKDLDITHDLSQNYRVYLGQGIPDPWKKWMSLEQEENEPSFENLKKDLKSYLESLKTGPGNDLCSTEKVYCPHCNKQVFLLCMKRNKSEREENKGKSPGNNDEEKDGLPNKEETKEQKIDANTQTETVRDNKGGKCSSCLLCNSTRQEPREKSEPEEELKKCKKYNCACKICHGEQSKENQNNRKNEKFTRPICSSPRECELFLGNNTNQNQMHELKSIPTETYDHNGFQFPSLYNTGPGICFCQSEQRMLKHNHPLLLMLVCPKCEKRKKKKAKKNHNKNLSKD